MNTEIIDFYLEGNSRKKTCNKFNITDTKLKNILKENNIHIRNHSEQLILENIDLQIFEKARNYGLFS